MSNNSLTGGWLGKLNPENYPSCLGTRSHLDISLRCMLDDSVYQGNEMQAASSLAGIQGRKHLSSPSKKSANGLHANRYTKELLGYTR